MRNRNSFIRSILGTAVAASFGPSALCSVEGQPQAATAAPQPAPQPKAPKAPAPKGKTAKKAKAAPKKAKKAARKPMAESTAALAEAAKSYHKDKKNKTAGGNVSIDNGDKVAKQLRGMKLDEVYKVAARELKEPESALRAKYKHLNEGMQRMNLGNRIRAAK